MPIVVLGANAPWPLHRRVADAALHAGLFGLLSAALALVFEGWRPEAAGVGAFVATAAFAVFGLQRRGAGPAEAIGRLAVAAAITAIGGAVAAEWAYHLLERGPFGAYEELAQLLEFGWRTQDALTASAVGSALGASVLAPVLVRRAAGAGVASQLKAAVAAPFLAGAIVACAGACGAVEIGLALGAFGAVAAVGVVGVTVGAGRLSRRLGWTPAAALPAAAPPRWARGLPWVLLATTSAIASASVAGHHGCHRPGYEAAAIGALKTISTCQALYREGDRDGNGALDYSASLAELGSLQLVDPVLAGGTKMGYRFTLVRPSDPEQSQLTWAAVAQPLVPGTTGDRSFFVNHTGTIWYTTAPSPLVITLPDCDPPPGMTQVGK